MQANPAFFKRHFKNSIKIVCHGDHLITSDELADGIKAAIGEKLWKEIDCFGQCISRNNWMVTFKPNANIADLFDKKVKIGNHEYPIYNPCDEFKYESFRLNWLPHALTSSDFANIFKSFSKHVEIISMQDCFYSREDIKHIKRPAKLVKIKYLRSLSKEVNISTGVFKLYEGVNILIQKLGEKPKCLLCGKLDHLKKDCPLKSTFCKKCTKRGHEASNCNYAARLCCCFVDFL